MPQPQSSNHRPIPKFAAHKQGRFVTTGEGFLQHREGERIDLHAYLANHSVSVDLLPIHTNLMRPSGLHHGSIAVVDRVKPFQLGQLVAVRFNGDLIIRRLDRQHGIWCFEADDAREPTLYVRPETKVERVGVIIHCIQSF